MPKWTFSFQKGRNWFMSLSLILINKQPHKLNRWQRFRFYIIYTQFLVLSQRSGGHFLMIKSLYKFPLILEVSALLINSHFTICNITHSFLKISTVYVYYDTFYFWKTNDVCIRGRSFFDMITWSFISAPPFPSFLMHLAYLQGQIQ